MEKATQLPSGGYYRQQKRLAIINKTFGDHYIEDITAAEVRDWWNGYSHARCARRDIYGLMKQILAVALDDEIIIRTPCRIKGASKAMAKPRPTFTEADIATLYFQTESTRDRALLTLLSGTAMRIDSDANDAVLASVCAACPVLAPCREYARKAHTYNITGFGVGGVAGPSKTWRAHEVRCLERGSGRHDDPGIGSGRVPEARLKSKDSRRSAMLHIRG